MEENVVKASPTVVTVDADLAKAQAFLKGIALCTLFEIEDYPIGRNARGRCRLAVEYKKGKGWRTVKQTTDKNGKWCKPHCSTFRDGFGSVITHPEITKKGKGAAWLSVCMRNIFLNYANGECETIVDAPCHGKPRRTPESFKIVSRTFGPLSTGGLNRPPEVTETAHTLAADEPALCDAWDLWERGVAAIQVELVKRLNLLRKAV